MSQNNTVKLVTHNGSFHADDIFACATLLLLLADKQCEVIRTRDEEVINSGDYVFDVGGIYDREKNRFDHHQTGGAGKRANGIEYASFGLVWEKFGATLSGSEEVKEIIEKRIVCAIDAGDNAMTLVEFTNEIKPYFIQFAFNSFYPTWDNLTDESLYKGFMECVEIAKNLLRNEIKTAKSIAEAKDAVMKIYNNSEDKRIIVLDKKYPYEEITSKLPEPMFVIYPRVDGGWGCKAERAGAASFKNKKDFPEPWAGLKEEELAKVTGVEDAVFCHRALFLSVAKSKEGAIKLAQIALQS